MSTKLSQKLIELHLHQSQSGTHCPMLPEEIAAHEDAGRIVDLDTGEVLPDITADTRVEPTIYASQPPPIPQDIDAAIIEIRAALDRLEQRPTEGNAFLRGYKCGAQSAYLDILRLLTGEG